MLYSNDLDKTLHWIKTSEEVDVSSRHNRCVVYSGGGGTEYNGQPVSESRRKAEEFCDKNKECTTLERTPFGQVLEKENRNLEAKFGKEGVDKIWAAASERYTKEASGSITAFVEEAKQEKVFRNNELKTLVNNEKVTDINGVHREGLKNIYDNYSLDRNASLVEIYSQVKQHRPIENLRVEWDGFQSQNYQQPKSEQKSPEQRQATMKEIESRNPETREFEVTLPSAKEAHITATGLEAKDDPKDLLAPEVIEELEKQKPGQTLKLNVTEVEQTLEHKREQTKQEQSSEQKSQLENQKAPEQERQKPEPSLQPQL